METSAPLRLLVPTGVSQTASLLREAGSSGDYFAISSGHPETANCIIVCRGLQLDLSVDEPVPLTGLKNIFCNIDEKSAGSVISIGLGNHLEGGEKVPAIVQAMLSAAVGIAQLSSAFAVIWEPARTISGLEYFSRVVAEYDEGGVFPVLALINFSKTDDGAIRSTGLEWLSGQELAVLPSLLSDSDLMRRIVRVAHDMAVGGMVSEETELAGIEPDEKIVLTPQIAERTLVMRTEPILVQ